MNTILANRYWAVSVLLLGLPFICCLLTVLGTQDRVPTDLTIRLLCNIIEFGSVLVSFAIPIVLIVRTRRDRVATLGSLFRFTFVWLIIQCIGLFVLVLTSLALFGDDMR